MTLETRKVKVRAIFSRHATDRLLEFLSLNAMEVGQILDDELFVLIGEEGQRKVHKLFWSKPDLSWFVAVQDKLDGEVITILPVHYHNLSHDHLHPSRK